MLGQVLAGQNGVHTGPGAGGGGVDAADATHLGGPDDGHVQHPGKDDVVDVAPLAADEAGVFLAQEGCAHEGLAGAHPRPGRGGGGLIGGNGVGHRGLPSSTSTYAGLKSAGRRSDAVPPMASKAGEPPSG